MIAFLLGVVIGAMFYEVIRPPLIRLYHYIRFRLFNY